MWRIDPTQVDRTGPEWPAPGRAERTAPRPAPPEHPGAGEPAGPRQATLGE